MSDATVCPYCGEDSITSHHPVTDHPVCTACDTAWPDGLLGKYQDKARAVGMTLRELDHLKRIAAREKERGPIDSMHMISEGKPRSWEETQKLAERLKSLCREFNVTVVFSHAEHVSKRVKFPVEVDMMLSLPKKNDKPEKIEMHILKSRAQKREPYTTLQAESSFCPECDKPVTLLSRVDMEPTDAAMFYICWDCKFLAEVGVGRVAEYEEPPEEDDGEKS